MASNRVGGAVLAPYCRSQDRLMREAAPPASLHFEGRKGKSLGLRQYRSLKTVTRALNLPLFDIVKSGLPVAATLEPAAHPAPLDVAITSGSQKPRRLQSLPRARARGRASQAAVLSTAQALAVDRMRKGACGTADLGKPLRRPMAG